MTEQEVIFRDFTRKRKQVVFGISGVNYECVQALGTEALQDLMNLYRGGDMQAALKANDAEVVMASIRSMFKIFLMDDAYAPFVEKLRDRKDPVDVHQLLEIVAWIVEVYADRPLGSSESSSSTSANGEAGTDSTAGAQLEESILLNSMPVAS